MPCCTMACTATSISIISAWESRYMKSPDFLKSMPRQAAAPSIVWFGIAGTNDSSDLETPLIMTSSPHERRPALRKVRRSQVVAQIDAADFRPDRLRKRRHLQPDHGRSVHGVLPVAARAAHYR